MTESEASMMKKLVDAVRMYIDRSDQFAWPGAITDEINASTKVLCRLAEEMIDEANQNNC